MIKTKNNNSNEKPILVADNDKGYFKYINETPIEFENHTIYKVKPYNNGQFKEEA